MFRQRCKRCDSKSSKKFQFCPNCGYPFKRDQNKQEYGLLGESDQSEMDEMLGGLGGGIFNKILSGAIKMLEKEMQKEINQMHKQEREIKPKNQNIPKTNFQLYVNGKKINIGEGIEMPPQMNVNKEKPSKKALPTPSAKIISESKNLPRIETETLLKRLPDKIVYELEAEGVKDLNQILVNKLEEGIEIKMFTKDKVLYKNLSVSLPLIAYYLKKQKLFLEFDPKQ